MTFGLFSKIFVLVLCIYSINGMAQESSDKLQTACELSNRPLTRTEQRDFRGVGEVYEITLRDALLRASVACRDAGFTNCQEIEDANDNVVTLRGTRTVALTRQEIRQASCARAGLCYDLAIVSSDARAFEYMQLAERVRSGYRCRNF
jgi:hypothetical protein